ncbi:hypothetical protein NP493_689g01015 [Ridgeia piscesae]|uniref:Cytoplasmic tRNA 2-thiolation protein 2 n=1 Tax=Ridgeia piscesae TaxID=27915 RepID=A0AAD9KR80_RIDPI|nr:hypothetical protein NP493_689g01015 [Ridgeia piscesae]
MMAHSATRLAVRMLADITQGRGAHLAYQMSFADSRRSDVTLVRPMREFSAKEIAVYNRLNNVSPVFIPSLSTKQKAGHSLDSLTEQFVLSLNTKSATTVNTICRTGEKLGLAKSAPGTTEDISIQSHCSMCEAPLDTLVGDASALASTRFSRAMCQKEAQGRDQTATPRDDCHISDSTVTPNDPHRSSCGMLMDIESGLCYGCLRLVRDMTDVSSLPDAMTRRTSADIMTREQMKEQIAEFLLEESDQAAAAI